MNIYFAWSIRGWRDDADLYQKIITHLQKYGTVLTEHIWLESLTEKWEQDITDAWIYERDMDWLNQADVVVAETTTTSFGVWYELGWAHSVWKKVLCLHRPAVNRLSAMIQWNPWLTVLDYEGEDDIYGKIDEYFSISTAWSKTPAQSRDIRIEKKNREAYKTLSLAMIESQESYMIYDTDEWASRSDEHWKHLLEKNDIFIAYDGDSPVGMCTSYHDGWEEFTHLVKLKTLYVLPGYRRKYVGESLMSTIMDRISSHEQYEKTWFFTRADNTQAIWLSHKLWWRRVWVLKKERKVAGEYFDEYIFEKVF